MLPALTGKKRLKQAISDFGGDPASRVFNYNLNLIAFLSRNQGELFKAGFFHRLNRIMDQIQ